MGTLPVFYIYSLRELILDLEIKKKKILKEIKWFILGHLATNWQRWYLIPIPKIPKLCFSNYALVCLHIQSKKKKELFLQRSNWSVLHINLFSLFSWSLDCETIVPKHI